MKKNNLTILFTLIFLISCVSSKKTSKNSNLPSIFSNDDLGITYSKSLKGSYPYMFSDYSKKTRIENNLYGEYHAGIKGLLLYTNFKKVIIETLIKNRKFKKTKVRNDFNSLEFLEKLSGGIPVFSSGEKNFSNQAIWKNKKHDFHHYNPGFIKWMSNNLIPSPETIIGGIKAKKLYKTIFSRFFRMMTESYIYLQNNNYKKKVREYKSNFKQPDFNGLEYLKVKYQGKITKYDNAENINTSMTSSMAIGFWLRRNIDGSHNEVWNALSSFMKIFDSEWFNSTLRLYKKC